MSRKGIILAGGYGTRLYPSTKCISKQIIPVYDKPMIYYPLSTLMEADIRDILIISTPYDMPFFQKLLDDGSQLGINIEYAIQNEPKGIAQAFIIGENFINDSPCSLILGDNIFYGAGFNSMLKKVSHEKNISTIFSCKVIDPHRFGVIESDQDGKIISIEEKPRYPKSSYAVTGLYFYDCNVVEFAKKLQPSKRDELEITDLNKLYLKKICLERKNFLRGLLGWILVLLSHCLMHPILFSHLKKQGYKICCPEEIAYKNKWVSEETILKNIKNNASSYNKYILSFLKHNARM